MRVSRTASAPAHRAQPQQRPVTPGGYNLPPGGGGSMGNLPSFASNMQAQNANQTYVKFDNFSKFVKIIKFSKFEEKKKEKKKKKKKKTKYNKNIRVYIFIF